MQWLAHAPANIALIKYMGKKNSELNIPDNASLSYTLANLISTVKIEKIPSKKDIWEPLIIPGTGEFSLSAEGQKRFLEHLARIKNHLGYTGGFLVESTNNFPQGTGLASSASSFAALTKCAVEAICDITQQALLSVDEQARISRLGSGSSCRSFYSPWALWHEEEVKEVALPYQQLLHQVIIISSQEKKILSRSAHQLVKTSPLYATRVERAEENLKVLLNALQAQDWQDAYRICWQEFQDMHQLFATCNTPFSYMTDNTQEMLTTLQEFWDHHNDGPIVTMDAGPNIHLLYRPDQLDLARQFKQDYLVGNYDVL